MESISTAGAVWRFFPGASSSVISWISEGVDGAQQEADFSSRFTLFHFHDPLPADADFLGERPLVKSELDAAIPNECAEVGWGSNSHIVPLPEK